MNLSETQQLLAGVAGINGRTVGQIDVRWWQKLLADYPLDDCITAVTQHYKETNEWIMPAHIIKRVKAMRAERIERAQPLPAPSSPSEAGYREQLRAIVRQAAAGLAPPRALSVPAEPPPEIAAQVAETRASNAHLSVRCPWCQASIGQPCSLPGHPGKRPHGGIHPARKRAAQGLPPQPETRPMPVVVENTSTEESPDA